MIGLVMSSPVFIPVLVTVLVFARKIVDHRVAFVTLGPVVMATIAFWSLDLGSAKLIALSVSVSSLVLFFMLQSKSFAADVADQPPSTA